jgi:hypothetical protein
LLLLWYHLDIHGEGMLCLVKVLHGMIEFLAHTASIKALEAHIDSIFCLSIIEASGAFIFVDQFSL